MLKKINLVSAILIISSITLFSQNFVTYGAKEKYYLSIEENNIFVDSNVVNNYDEYNFSLDHQVPVQRYLKGANYELFIGLAVSDTPEEINIFYRNNSDYEILLSDTLNLKKRPLFKIFIKTKDKYLYKIIFKTRKSVYTTVFTYVSSNKQTLLNIYNDEKFFETKLNKKVKKR